MDIRSTAQAMGIDFQEYLSFVELLVTANSRDLPELVSALTRGDCIRVTEIAHQIKGAAINLDLPDIYGPAEALENAGRSGDRERAMELKETLAQACSRLADEVATKA